MFVGGLTLVFINPIRDYFVKRSADKLSLENYTVEQIKENKQQENDVDFEFEAVQSLMFYVHKHLLKITQSSAALWCLALTWKYLF